MVSVKQGLGGHGLQAYETETGKYVEVSVSLNGREAKNFDEYLDIAIQTSDSFREKYRNDESGMTEKLFNRYKDGFQKRVDTMNAENDIQRFEDGEDFERNMESAINDSMVENLSRFCPMGYDASVKRSPYSEDYLDGVNVSIMNGKFGTPLLNPISEKTFERMYNSKKVNKAKTEEEYFNVDGDAKRMKDYLKSLPDGVDVAWFRCMYGLDKGNANKIVIGYYDKGMDVISNISRFGGAGSGIYVSPSRTIKDTEIDGGYFNKDEKKTRESVMIHGLIKNPSQLRIACSNWNRKDDDEDQQKVKSLQKAASKLGFVEKMANILHNKGYDDDMKNCRDIANTICYKIQYDFGLAAALLGYDMVTGYGNEMVVLNPRVMDISTTYHSSD